MKHEEDIGRRALLLAEDLLGTPEVYAVVVPIIEKHLRQVEAETIERVRQELRKLEISEPKDDEEWSYHGAIIDAQVAINEMNGSLSDCYKGLSPNPTPTKSVVPEGWRLVPVEPSEKQIRAGCVVMGLNYKNYSEWMAKHYRAMIQAAPNGAEGE